jgi:hypothetical protein
MSRVGLTAAVASSGQDVSDFECNSKGCRAFCAGSACDVVAMCVRFLGEGVDVTTSATYLVAVAKAMKLTACYQFGGSIGPTAWVADVEVLPPAGTTVTPQSFATGRTTTVTVNGKGLRASDRLLLVAGGQCLGKGKYPTQSHLSPVRALSSSSSVQNTFLVTVPNGQDGVWSACYSYGKKGDFSSKVAALVVVKPPKVSSFSIGAAAVKLDKLSVGQRTLLTVVGSGLTFKDRVALVERNEKGHQPCSAASNWVNHIAGASSSDFISEAIFEISVARSSEFALCYEFGGGYPSAEEIGTLLSA